MKLTKQEQTVIIGQLINNVVGVELARKHIEPQKLEKAVSMHNKLNDDMTPRECREALISILGKAVDEFLDSK